MEFLIKVIHQPEPVGVKLLLFLLVFPHVLYLGNVQRHWGVIWLHRYTLSHADLSTLPTGCLIQQHYQYGHLIQTLPIAPSYTDITILYILKNSLPAQIFGLFLLCWHNWFCLLVTNNLRLYYLFLKCIKRFCYQTLYKYLQSCISIQRRSSNKTNLNPSQGLNSRTLLHHLIAEPQLFDSPPPLSVCQYFNSQKAKTWLSKPNFWIKQYWILKITYSYVSKLRLCQLRPPHY